MNKLVLTNAGRTVLNNIIAESGTLQFSTAKSTSDVINVVDIPDMTELTNIKQSVSISSVENISNTNTKLCVVFNGNIDTSYKLCAVGIYVVHNNSAILFAVGIESNNVYVNPNNSDTIINAVKYTFNIAFNDNSIVNVVNPIAVTQEQLKERLRNTGEYTIGKNYAVNDLFTNDNGTYIVNSNFTASTTIDFSKVTFLGVKSKYDHFKIEIDMSDVNPTKDNGKIVYSGGCENFTVDDWANWFGYKPVVMEVQSNGELTVIHECNTNNYKQSVSGTDLLPFIKYASQYKYHSMVQYPTRGYKINYDYSNKKATIYLTNDPCNKNYSYYAFNNGCVSNSNLYVSTYPLTLFTVGTKSYATSETGGSSPTKSGYSLSEFRTSITNTSGFLQHFGYIENTYFQIMHICHYGKISGNIQYTYGSANAVCGCGDTAGLNGGVSSHKAVKMFGLEVHTGIWEWVDNVKVDDNNCIYINTSDNSATWEYVCKSNCNGYVGNNIVWNEKIGLLAINADSTSDKYFRTDHIHQAGKFMVKATSNIFNMTMNQTESYKQGTTLISRMIYKR